MDKSEHLILIKSNDKTANVKWIKYNPVTQRCDVTYNSGATYPFSYNSIEWIKDPKTLDPNIVRIERNNKYFDNIQDIRIFIAKNATYWYIHFADGKEKTYNRNDIDVSYTCLEDPESQKCLNYLKKLAPLNELKTDDGELMLQKQYEKLNYVSEHSLLAHYLNPSKRKMKKYQNNLLIFPFGSNESQFEAVENALQNQLSIIQGPPGTGKTQTILNIIANLLVVGKTIQVASNNNPAVLNVMEKLSNPQYDLGFLVAYLGKDENKKEFIKNQTGLYPFNKDWELLSEQISNLEMIIRNSTELITTTFSKQKELAKLKAEYDSVKLEMKYFEQYLMEMDISLQSMKLSSTGNDNIIMQLWQECNQFNEKDRPISLWFKIKSTFIYRITEWRLFDRSPFEIISFYQKSFYHIRKNYLCDNISKLEFLVVSGNEQPADSNINDLISYIHYNNFEIIQSEIRSVFDLMYRQYTKARIAFLKKHNRISRYDTENLMYGNIVELLDKHHDLSLEVICHQPLYALIRDTGLLNEKQERYVKHQATHIDFVLYNRISKIPVLAIEVDGFSYHKPGSEQYARDLMKDRILELYGIPLFRFPTYGSGEREKIELFLMDRKS